MGNYIYMVRFISGHMPSTAIERDEGHFSSAEKAEKWIMESYEICEGHPGDDRLYIEKHSVDKKTVNGGSSVVKEIKVRDLLAMRKEGHG